MTRTRIGGGYKDDWRSVGTEGVIKKVGRMVGKAMILKRWTDNPSHDGKQKKKNWRAYLTIFVQKLFNTNPYKPKTI